jgi:hypothetical protein
MSDEHPNRTIAPNFTSPPTTHARMSAAIPPVRTTPAAFAIGARLFFLAFVQGGVPESRRPRRPHPRAGQERPHVARPLRMRSGTLPLIGMRVRSTAHGQRQMSAFPWRGSPCGCAYRGAPRGREFSTWWPWPKSRSYWSVWCSSCGGSGGPTCIGLAGGPERIRGRPLGSHSRSTHPRVAIGPDRTSADPRTVSGMNGPFRLPVLRAADWWGWRPFIAMRATATRGVNVQHYP